MSDKRKKSFVLHIDSLDILDDLEDEQVANLFRAIKAFQNDEEPELDAMTKLVFLPFKNQFIRDNDKYEETRKRRAEAGSKGGKAKVANASKTKQKVAKQANQANLADSDSKSDSDSDSDSKSKKERSSRFTPPTLEQVQAYCFERNNFVDPQSFINHYESNGWMRGKTKIKDWKACVRTWENNQSKKQSNHNLSGYNYESGDL